MIFVKPWHKKKYLPDDEHLRGHETHSSKLLIVIFPYLVNDDDVDDDVLLQTIIGEENELNFICSLDHPHSLSLFKASETL